MPCSTRFLDQLSAKSAAQPRPVRVVDVPAALVANNSAHRRVHPTWPEKTASGECRPRAGLSISFDGYRKPTSIFLR